MKQVKLGDIFEIARGGSPRPINDFLTNDPDGINWVMIGDATQGDKYITSTKKKIRKNGASRSRKVKPGDFLLTNSMSFGHPYIMKTDGCIHDGWLVLSKRSNEICEDYFYHLLGSPLLYHQFSAHAAGATVKNLNIGIVEKIEISLPPLDEQKRIAAMLDKADAIRRKRAKALRLTDQFLQSVLLNMFGDPVTNSKKWSESRLDEVADIASGVTKGRRFNGRKTVLVPYMRVASVQDGYLRTDIITEIEVLPEDVERYRLQPGDVLLTEGGDPDKLGRGAVWRGEIETCIHQNHIFRVRPQESLLDSDYLSALIGSRRGKAYFAKAAKQTTGIASINMTQLKAFPALVPPLSLQSQFADLVSKNRELTARLQDAASVADALFTSITQRAFQGTL